MASRGPESRVKAQVRTALRSAGFWYCMPIGGMFGRAGIPDFLVSANGVMVGIETKAGGRKPTPLQTKTLSDISASGAVALVIDESNVNQTIELVVTHANSVRDKWCGGSAG